jgi:hypothetical protein
MDSQIRTAFVIKFPDGQYLGTHKSQHRRSDNSVQVFGRRVSFQKARIFSSRGSVSGSFHFLNDPTAKVVEIYVSEPVEIAAERELESV